MAKRKPNYWHTRHIEYVKNQTAKAVQKYNMIRNGEKVLAAVSGGKDSLIMLEALSGFQKFGIINFHLEAIHVDVEDVSYAVDRNFLHQYCRQLAIPLHIKTIAAGLEQRGKKAPCFVCSWHRRKTLFSFAKENGFEKLALGHHMDDAVETLLINMAYHGHISSLPGKLKMFDGLLSLIRPLILLRDKDMRDFARIRQLPELTSECPYADTTHRTVARNLLAQMNSLHPKAVENLFHSLQNIDNEYLP